MVSKDYLLADSMAFIVPTRRLRPQIEPMLAHAKSGHWYVTQAWAKALNETPLSRANCGQYI